MRHAGNVPLSFDDLVEPFELGRGLPAAALRAFGALVAELTESREVVRVLEPGIGSGRIALPLVQRGCRVTGVDISRPMLDRLTGKARDLPGRCETILADATALPFPAGTFDLAYAASLFYLIPDWRRALAELARVVQPGGHVLVCVERSRPDPALARFDAAWREAVDATGFRHQAATLDDETVIRSLATRIGPVERRVLARWTIGQTVGEALDGYGPRLRPLYAAVPDLVWQRMVDGFVAGMRATFPDPATRLDCQVSFEVAIAPVS